MRCVVSCGSTSFPWLVFFFAILLWGSMVHKRTGRWMWQGSTSVISWSWEKYSCQSKLVSALSMLLLSMLSCRAQSTTKDYIRAKTNLNLSPIYSAHNHKTTNSLKTTKSVLTQIDVKKQTNLHKRQTQNFRRISPFGFCPCQKPHKARTRW